MSRSLGMVFSALWLVAPVFAQSPTHIMGIGDSLAEGVQSANAFSRSQQQTFVNFIATQARLPLQLPLINSGPTGFVGVANGRSRVSSTSVPQEIGVSGAKLADVLTATADHRVHREVDLVLAPYYGMSQVEIVEQVKPGIVFCWAGNDDIINYVLDFTHLNTPQDVTSLPDFTSQYQQLLSRLKATGAKVVVANIPDLTKIAFMFSNEDLTRYLGTDYHLPTGSLTTLGAAILVKLGQETPAIFSDPAYVLNATQIGNIQNQIVAYNQVISQTAATNGFPVVDAYAIVNSYVTKPITIDNVTITLHYNGGAFSLDGIHPSNTGYAIFANAFIKQANAAYGVGIPEIPFSLEKTIFESDPFADFNGNGIVPGRPDTGLLESLGPGIGLSGDTNDRSPSQGPAPVQKADAGSFMRSYFQATGRDPNGFWRREDVVAAVRQMLGAPAQ